MHLDMREKYLRREWLGQIRLRQRLRLSLV
jgi:hypothetical protein